MKIRASFFITTGLALLAGGFFATSTLNAADNPPPAAAGPTIRSGPATGMAPMRAGPGWLDEKQRELLRESMQKNRPEMMKLEEQLRSAQKDLAKVVLSEKSDDKAIREKADAIAKIQSDQTMLRAKIVSVVVPTLKPEQKEQIENNPMMFRMLMESPMGLGMGMGGMTRPGMGPGAAPGGATPGAVRPAPKAP